MKINGTNLRIYINRNGSLEAIAFATSCALSLDTNMVDATDKEDLSFRDIMSGLISWKVDTANLCSLTPNSNNGNELTKKQLTKTPVYIKIDSVDANQGNDFYYYGAALISSCSITASNEDITTMSINLEGKGVLNQIKRDNLLDSIGLVNGKAFRKGNNIVTVGNGEWYIYDYVGNQVDSFLLGGDWFDLEGDRVIIISSLIGGVVRIYDSAREEIIAGDSFNTANTLDVRLKSDNFFAMENEELVVGSYGLGTISISSIILTGQDYLDNDHKGIYYKNGTGIDYFSFSSLRQGVTTPVNVAGIITDTIVYAVTQNSGYYFLIQGDGLSARDLRIYSKKTDSTYSIVLTNFSSANTINMIVDEEDNLLVFGEAASGGNLIEKYQGRNRELLGSYDSPFTDAFDMKRAINLGSGLVGFYDSTDEFIGILNNIL